jgi:hypothetical protein
VPSCLGLWRDLLVPAPIEVGVELVFEDSAIAALVVLDGAKFPFFEESFDAGGGGVEIFGGGADEHGGGPSCGSGAEEFEDVGAVGLEPGGELEGSLGAFADREFGCGVEGSGSEGYGEPPGVLVVGGCWLVVFFGPVFWGS